MSLVPSLRHALPKAPRGGLRNGNRPLQPLTQFSRMSLISSPSLSFFKQIFMEQALCIVLETQQAQGTAVLDLVI